MIYFAKTHQGKVRRNNEDSIYAPMIYGSGYFAVVADGMGGHNAGEVASGIVVDTLRERLNAVKPNDVTEILLRSAFTEANSRVLADARANPDRSGMGSTATAAVIYGDAAMIGHVGDSRAYLFREGLLKQLTRDHSYVQMLLDLGYINEQQAAEHPQKNIITRAVGTEEDMTADIYHVTLKDGDCLLLCTDGLNVMISDTQIAEILGGGFESAADQLVEAALEAGGADNVSVVLIVKDGDRA